MKKEDISNYIDVIGNLKTVKLKKEHPNISHEEIYKIHYSHSGYCINSHKLKFISFASGYKECSICKDLEDFYSLSNLKEYSKEHYFTSTQLVKIKNYYSITEYDIFLWNNEKEYCPICGKENIFYGQKGYAKTCSQKCGNNLKRRKLNSEEQKLANQKRKETNLKTFGKECNLELLDNSKENNCIHKSSVIEKKNNTMLEKYGTIYPLANKDIKEKFLTTFKENSKPKPFGTHVKRNHFKNISDFNEDFIKDTFINNGSLDVIKFQEYFNCSPNTTLRVMRELNIWVENVSLPEQIIRKYLVDFVKSKRIISPFELDFYSSKYNFAVEVNGDYWHSIEAGAQKNYHKMKTDLCEEKGVMLYQFFENEILEKEEIIASMLSNVLGNNTKVYARKCSIKEISTKEAKEFFLNNHIQGYAKSSIKIGLFYENNLVFCISLGKPRFTDEAEFEIIRMASKLNHVVVGGFSKVLKYFEKKFNPSSILSYANRRWSMGKSYEKMGFQKIRTTPPNFFYYKQNRYYHRQELQAHKLKNVLNTYDINLSTEDNIKNNGYYKIFDAGNLVYLKEY